jgi:hypothetical protein
MHRNVKFRINSSHTLSKHKEQYFIFSITVLIKTTYNLRVQANELIIYIKNSYTERKLNILLTNLFNTCFNVLFQLRITLTE